MRRHAMQLILMLAVMAALAPQAHSQAREELAASSAVGVTVGRGKQPSENIGPSSTRAAAERRHRPWFFPFVMVRDSPEKILRDLDRRIAKAGPDAVLALLAQAAAYFPQNNLVNVTARHAGGRPFYIHTGLNLRTNTGDDWQADLMGVSGVPTDNNQCEFVAVSNDAGAPAQADTTLTGEITLNGLARAVGTYAHTTGTSTYTIAKTFTATGTQASQKTGLFTAASAGTMCFENTYTSVTVNNTDTLTVTWTINF